MAKHLTSKTLIESIVRRGMLPISNSTFTEADLLAMANEEMDIGVLPLVLSFHEDYLLHEAYLDVTPNVSVFEIPYRSTGNKLRDIAYVDVSGNVFEMTRVQVSDVTYYQNGPSTSVGLRAFYIEGDEIILLPTGRHSMTGQLKISYYMRPNSLVAESRVATITGINLTTGVLTVSSIPTNLLKLNTTVLPNVYELDPTLEMDILQTRSPHKRLAINAIPTAIDTTLNTITFDPAIIPSYIRVGDYIALTEESIIPNIPTELHSMLAQRVVCRVLEALGDTQGLANANQKLAEMEIKTGNLIDARVEDASLKVVNRHGFLRMSRRQMRR